MIKFVCPNGHPLTAQDNLAGKPGDCPKCHAPFVVPTAEMAASQAASPGGSGSGAVLAAGSSGQSGIAPAMGSGKGKAPGEVFVFLCPNGHKLNGPPSLKGKPGQCPHCGARFIIPTDEDIQRLEEETSDQIDEETRDEPLDDDQFDINRIFSDGQTTVSRPPAGPSGLGYIVARLWDCRSEQTELEIFLSEGEIIAPDYFSELLSTSDYGVFGIVESDGSLAVTIVPWNTVRRVSMRRIDELPSELFQ